MDVTFSKFSSMYMEMRFTDEIDEKVEEILKSDFDEAVKIIEDYLCLADSPYELNGFLHDPIDPLSRDWVLDLVFRERHRWDREEVLCFFIESCIKFGEDLSVFSKLDKCNVFQFHSVAELLWQMFWSDDDYYREIFFVISHLNNLQTYVTSQLKGTFKNKFKNETHLNIAIEYFEQSKIDDHMEVVRLYDKALCCYNGEKYYETVEILQRMLRDCPVCLKNQIITYLVKSLSKIGCSGIAYNIIREEQETNDNFKLYNGLLSELMQPNQSQIEKIKSEKRKPFWTEDCSDIFAVAELLYRYHGRLLHDCSGIVSGYSRALESQLRVNLLPKIKRLIKKFGAEDGERRYVNIRNIKGKKKGNVSRLYLDQIHEFTLGTWAMLLYDEEFYKHFDEKGEFYYCIANYEDRLFGYYEFGKCINEFGKKIFELTNYRNLASHGSLKNWDRVERARDLVSELLDGVRTRGGNLLS